jgi:hypothetical protein
LNSKEKAYKQQSMVDFLEIYLMAKSARKACVPITCILVETK